MHLSLKGYLLLTETSLASIQFNFLFENCLCTITCVIASDHTPAIELDDCTLHINKSLDEVCDDHTQTILFWPSAKLVIYNFNENFCRVKTLFKALKF